MIWRSESVAAHWRTEYNNLFNYNKEFYGQLLTGSHTFQPIIEWKRLLHAYLAMLTIRERPLLLWRRLLTSVSIELMGTLRPYLPGPTFASNQDFQCRPVHGWAKSGLRQAQKMSSHDTKLNHCCARHFIIDLVAAPVHDSEGLGKAISYPDPWISNAHAQRNNKIVDFAGIARKTSKCLGTRLLEKLYGLLYVLNEKRREWRVMSRELLHWHF